jgi:selenocysteine lyase/cysteine desulfurase
VFECGNVLALDLHLPYHYATIFTSWLYCCSAGSGQYTTSQLQAVMQELEGAAFGNPHSRNASSLRATQEIAAARQQVLAHFNADPEQYHCIFTK